MTLLLAILDLDRCPQCGIDSPNLSMVSEAETTDKIHRIKRHWRIYVCGKCGGLVTASAIHGQQEVLELFPSTNNEISDAIPAKAREYLRQGINSLQSPVGAVMLAANTVDAMLKEKGYKEGSLNERIKKAANEHLITDDMAQWAHEVRLDANDQRHVDDNAPMPTEQDAKRSLEFARALAEILFVLPSRIKRGLQETQPSK